MIVENYKESFDLNIKELISKDIKSLNFRVKLINDEDKIKVVVNQYFNDEKMQKDDSLLICLDFNFYLEKIIKENVEWIKISIRLIPDNLLKLIIKIKSNFGFTNELFGLSSINTHGIIKKLDITAIEKQYIFGDNVSIFINRYSNETKAGNIDEEMDKLKCPIKEKDYSDFISKPC